MRPLVLTTNPGLEDVAGRELAAAFARAGLPAPRVEYRPFGMNGHVMLHCSGREESVLAELVGLRSVYHLLGHLDHTWLEEEDPAGSMERICAGLEVPEMEQAASFRVTCNRAGDHPFTSMDVQRLAGAALQRRYGTPVDLERFAMNVRIDIVGRLVLIRLQLTREPLDRRHPRVYHPRITLKAPVAYGLLCLAGTERLRGAVLDPFCGSGTILMEAAQVLPDTELCGSDRDAAAVAGARRNLEAAGAAGRVRLLEADARDLAEVHPPGSFTGIVTNPPYGIQLGRNTDFRRLYSRLLEGAHAVLRPHGRVALLVGRRRSLFNRVVAAQGSFRIVHARVIETARVYPGLFVLERTD